MWRQLKKVLLAAATEVCGTRGCRESQLGAGNTTASWLKRKRLEGGAESSQKIMKNGG